jgi:hypothetical protein
MLLAISTILVLLCYVQKFVVTVIFQRDLFKIVKNPINPDNKPLSNDINITVISHVF